MGDIRWGRFIWNREKAERNLRRGRPSFYQGASAFDDREGVVIDDKKHSINEPRQWLIAKCSNAQVLLIVFTEREGNLTRIISVRRANKKERKTYEQNK